MFVSYSLWTYRRCYDWRMKALKKTVFLDRDGTINVEKNYLYKIEDFEFLPGVIEGLKILQKEGFQLIIITNQSGIARGYYTEKQYHLLNEWMLNELANRGVHITATYYCPHHPDAKLEEFRVDCSCRKPKTKLFERAIQKFSVDVNNSFAIGDKMRDCAICEKTACKGFLVGKGENEKIIEDVKRGRISNVSYAKSVLEAAQKIVYVHGIKL